MKNKLLISLAAALGLAFAAEAQTISVGPRVGATLSKIYTSGNLPDNYAREQSYKAGIQFGAVANIALNDRLSVQPELLVVQKGNKARTKQEEEGFIFEAESASENTYIELPALAKISFGTGDLKYFITVGPTIGYWLKGKSEADFTYTDYHSDEEGSVSSGKFEQEIDFGKEHDGFIKLPEYKRFETGASVGAGVAYKVGEGAFTLDARYGLGLSALAKTSNKEDKSKNRVLGLSLAYLFSL